MYFIHNDHLGTPQVVTDKNQNIVWEANKKPFGDTEETTATIDQFARFPGQYFDEESGLSYNYFRDYDPTTGRYIQADPIGILRDYSNPQMQVAIAHGFLDATGYANEALNHLYGYVGQNPLYWYDPYGLAKNKNKGKKLENPNRRKGAENRGKSGARERNVRPERGKGEEHSRRPKGGLRPKVGFPLVIPLPPEVVRDLILPPVVLPDGVPSEC